MTQLFPKANKKNQRKIVVKCMCLFNVTDLCVSESSPIFKIEIIFAYLFF